MLELPLFPLNTVLFPGAPLRLHIFEERYKRMINLCLQGDQPFGVVLIQRGFEAHGPLADPHPIGVTARITQVQHLPDGRLNISAIGEERFRIISLERDLQPYLVGYVEQIQAVSWSPVSLTRLGAELRIWVDRYLLSLAESGVGQLDSSQLPDDPIGLAYLSASFLQLTNQQKQALLSLEQAAELVSAVIRFLRREIAFMKAFSMKGYEGQGAFSAN